MNLALLGSLKAQRQVLSAEELDVDPRDPEGIMPQTVILMDSQKPEGGSPVALCFCQLCHP